MDATLGPISNRWFTMIYLSKNDRLPGLCEIARSRVSWRPPPTALDFDGVWYENARFSQHLGNQPYTVANALFTPVDRPSSIH